MNRRLGETYLALDKTLDKLVVIEKVKGLAENKTVKRSVRVLKNCQSSFIMNYFDVFRKRDEYWVRSP